MLRRSVIAGAAATLVVPVVMSAAAAGRASAASATAMAAPQPKNEKDFRMGVIGPAEFSLATSKIAVDKATQADAKEFAGFELTEAIAVTSVLTDLDTPVPEMSAEHKATLDKITNAAKGPEFDKAYISAQLENHEFLRDLAEAYLSNPPPPKTDLAEGQGRHLATLALAVFKEHVAITTRILKELGG